MPNHKLQTYKGRFAPSPTGPVHFGTLIAAIGSYLQAKKNQGKWLLRMEDVDITRKVDGADTDILHTLESFGFEWDGAIIYQSRQTEYYEQALEQLVSESMVFPCTCSRKKLAETNSNIYPGFCRSAHLPVKSEHALRVLADNINIEFNDAVMGNQIQNIEQQCGDFIIRRRDNLFAYQLAVVVDDALQNVTEVVRGADLLGSTARQIYLQQLLHYPTPSYCHLPLAVDAAGNKISKSEGAAKIDLKNKEKTLIDALNFLGQQVPAELLKSNLEDIWMWAIINWNIKQVPTVKSTQT